MKIKGLKGLINSAHDVQAALEEKFEQFYNQSGSYQNSVAGQEVYTFLNRVEDVLNDILELNDEI